MGRVLRSLASAYAWLGSDSVWARWSWLVAAIPMGMGLITFFLAGGLGAAILTTLIGESVIVIMALAIILGRAAVLAAGGKR